MELADLTHSIIGSAMRVHSTLGPGFLESVYRKALEYELGSTQLSVAADVPLGVTYRGFSVGRFVADMLVAGVVLVEVKAVRALAPAHEVQLVNYLTATGLDIGLLLNFGAERLEYRRKHRSHRSRTEVSPHEGTPGA